ncbi:DUF3159 domain-containing protein [Modestobacter sp. SYSU DS0290]
MTGAPGSGPADDSAAFTFDRHLVLDQLGGWRGMVDASLPTVAFVVANAIGGLRVGIWTAVAAAVVVFLLRLVRRQTVQQAISGLFAVAVAVVIAWRTGEARDFFVLGIVRNAGIGVVLIGSLAFRRPLVGVVAEWLAPSHLGAMAAHRLPSFRDRLPGSRRPVPAVDVDAAAEAVTQARQPDVAPEVHWRDDPRMLRAYSWLTVLWGGVFLLRAVVQGVFYWADEVGWLGTSSVVLGLPVTAVQLVVTLWVVARLHRHRSPEPAPDEQRPA